MLRPEVCEQPWGEGQGFDLESDFCFATTLRRHCADVSDPGRQRTAANQNGSENACPALVVSSSLIGTLQGCGP